MNNSNYSPYRSQYASPHASRPMPPATCYRPPVPQQPQRGGYGSGFCDGLCDGAGKVLGVAVKALPFIRFFR